MEKEISKDSNKLYLCHNDVESLYKLKELFKAMGLDINYDYSKGEAYIKINGSYYKMKKGNNCFYINKGDNLIGFSFATTSLMFNYGTIMDVIVTSGKDIKYLEYCQGKSLDNFEHPYTIYLSYVDGKVNQFFSDNRYIEFTEGNTINFKVAELIRQWELSFKHSIFEIPYYHEFGCGTKEKKIYNKQIQELGKIFIPTASLDLVDKFRGRKRNVIAADFECLYEDYEYFLKAHRKMDTTRLAFYDTFGGRTLVDPNLPENGAKYPDPKCLDFCMKIMTLDEAKKIYDSVVDEIKKDYAYRYIDSYFGELIESVKNYQEDGSSSTCSNDPIHFLELKNK